MKVRSKITLLLALLIVFSLTIVACSKKDNSKIKIAVEGAYPPFSQTEADGTITGFDIDIANALCEEIGLECELVAQEWDGMIPGLLAKKYDIILASMSITKERKEKVNFTDKYYSTTASFVTSKEGPNSEINIVSDIEEDKVALAGKRIGVQKGTVTDNFVTANFGEVAEIKRYAKQEEVNLDLISGRLDMLFVDTVAILDFLKSPEGEPFAINGVSFSDSQWFGDGIGIAVRKEDTDLLDKLNQGIATIRENGKFAEINNHYFDFNIYGE